MSEGIKATWLVSLAGPKIIRRAMCPFRSLPLGTIQSIWKVTQDQVLSIFFSFDAQYFLYIFSAIVSFVKNDNNDKINVYEARGPFLESPRRKLFGPVWPFLVHLYLKHGEDKCIRLELLV